MIRGYLKRETDEGPAGVVELADDVRRHGKGHVRLRKLTMRDEHGALIDRLKLGAPCDINLTFEVTEPVAGLVVLVAICAADGTRIVATLSVDDGAAPLSWDPGMQEVTVRLQDMQLLPGEYCIEVGVHDQNETATYDYVERVIEFTSLAAAHDGVRPYTWETTIGYMRPASRWSFHGPALTPTPWP